MLKCAVQIDLLFQRSHLLWWGSLDKFLALVCCWWQQAAKRVQDPGRDCILFFKEMVLACKGRAGNIKEITRWQPAGLKIAPGKYWMESKWVASFKCFEDRTFGRGEGTAAGSSSPKEQAVFRGSKQSSYLSKYLQPRQWGQLLLDLSQPLLIALNHFYLYPFRLQLCSMEQIDISPGEE